MWAVSTKSVAKSHFSLRRCLLQGVCNLLGPPPACMLPSASWRLEPLQRDGACLNASSSLLRGVLLAPDRAVAVGETAMCFWQGVSVSVPELFVVQAALHRQLGAGREVSGPDFCSARSCASSDNW